jgi:HK97 family phage major capsid protein
VKLSQLREARAEYARAARRLLDSSKGKPWAASQQRDYDASLAAINRVDGEISALERARDGQADATIQDAIDTAYRERRAPCDRLFDTFVRKGYGGFSDQEQLAIRNTMSTTTSSQGGYTVPTLVADRFADLLKDYSGVRRVAEVLKTATGGPLGYPTSDGTAETAELVAENAAATALDPSFGNASLQTWKYSSKFVAVPFELLYDSSIDIEAFLLRRFASRIGRLSNTHFTTGTGTGQPTGFTGAAGSGKVGTTGETTSVIHDDLVDLVHSVNTAYRQSPVGLAFQMADVTFKFIRKIKDATTNRPVYLPSDGVQPETLLGYPVVVNDDIAVMAANAKSIFFGNWFECYKVRDSLDVTLLRIADSVYITKGQIGFLAFARIGGNLVDANGVKYFQNSAT